MSTVVMPEHPAFAAEASSNARSEFITRTYLHLAGAVIVFVILEMILLSMPGVENMVSTMVSGWNWLIVLGAFLLVSHFAERMARTAVSLPAQYAGLAIYLLAQAVIFVPLIFVAAHYGGENVFLAAGVLTGVLFGGMTLIVFLTRKDFSFLRGALYMAGIIALVLIACSIFFNFDLGIIFTALMLGFACLWILYDTSNVLHHYRTDQYVVASLALFASLALLFWYALRLAMYLNSRD